MRLWIKYYTLQFVKEYIFKLFEISCLKSQILDKKSALYLFKSQTTLLNANSFIAYCNDSLNHCNGLLPSSRLFRILSAAFHFF